MSRTKAILKVLRRGGEDVGKAERATLDGAVERAAANASAVFWLRVDSESAS